MKIHTFILTFILTLILTLILSIKFAFSADVPIPGNFTSPDGAMPKGWTMHTWGGYEPFPTVRCSEDGPKGAGVVCLSEIHGRDGGAIHTEEFFPARSGDVGRATFFAKGRGEMWVTFYRWGEKHEWNGVVPAARIPLTDTWQPHEITLPVDNGHACQTRSVRLAIGGIPGSEVQVADMKLSIQPSEITGDRRLPKSWKVFTPISKEFVPEPESLKTLPETFAGRTPQTASLPGGALQVEGTSEVGATAWVFAEMESPYDCDFTFRARAESGLRLFFNGEEIARPDLPEDAIPPVTVTLKKGMNMFAFQTPVTTDGATIRMAGPKDLRGGIRALKIKNLVTSENFDNAELQCSGNPERIQGYPTPGLLAATGQGVFRTDSALDIRFKNDILTLPPAEDSELFAVGGLRIQNLEQNSQFEIRCASQESGKPLATCEISRADGSDWAEIRVRDANGAALETFPVGVKSFPANVLFGVNGVGRWTFFLASLVDSRTVERSGGLALAENSVRFNFRLTSQNSKHAEITVDNLVLGDARREQISDVVPFKVDVFPEFDPVKAGWKLVFSDEFDSEKLDMSKWYFSSTSDEKFAKVHDGQLEIVCDWNAEHSKLKSASIYSTDTYGYGYYEARVKFRKESGWWSAFWLCTHGPSNPFVDGWEIDVYEDYYMGPRLPDMVPRNMLDHNLHVFACGTLRSWNYNSILPGPADDFYTVGCKWTPFEVTYYLNGRRIRSEANHSPYDSVTFDPFSHAAGFVPLHAIVSGCVGRSGGDPKLGKFPESFYVDYVRIYEFPEGYEPSVQLAEKPDTEQFILIPGETMRFTADVQPSKETGAKISIVYLFDSGALLDYKTEPPYTFDVPVTREYYDRTNFVKPGRTGIRADFDRGLHAYCIFAQDENGQVGHSEVVSKLMRKQGVTRPYLGKVHELPGTIPLSHYDEGGQGVAYSDGTPENIFSTTFRPGEAVDTTGDTIGGVGGGEWLKYTIQVKEAGKYTFRLSYGTPSPKQRGPLILLNNRILGEFQTPAHEADNWGTDTLAELPGISLPAGEHELVLFLQGSYNISTLSVEAE